MDDEIQETVESILGKGVKVVDCEKKSSVREEEVLLINGCPIPLEGEDGAAIKDALIHGNVPNCDLLNQILIRAGILKTPVRLETSLSVKSSVVTREEVTVAKGGHIVDERTKEIKEDNYYTSNTSEVWEPVGFEPAAVKGKGNIKIIEQNYYNAGDRRSDFSGFPSSSSCSSGSADFKFNKNSCASSDSAFGPSETQYLHSCSSGCDQPRSAEFSPKQTRFSSDSTDSFPREDCFPTYLNASHSSSFVPNREFPTKSGNISFDSSGRKNLTGAAKHSEKFLDRTKRQDTSDYDDTDNVLRVLNGVGDMRLNESRKHNLSQSTVGASNGDSAEFNSDIESAQESAPPKDDALVYRDGNLISGSMDALVRHMVPTADYYPDRAYLFAFLLSSRLFIKPHELLGEVCALCDAQQHLGGKDPPSKESLGKFIPHFVQLLAEWTETFPYDFRDERVMVHVRTITQKCVTIDPSIRKEVSTLLQNLLVRLTTLEKYEEFLQRISAESSTDSLEGLGSTDVTELCASPGLLAQQLTHIELERLSYIGPEEFVQAFAKENPNLETSFKDMKKTRNLESYVSWFNRLSYLVATEVCKHPKKKQRVRVMEYWIETARECFNIGNFNSLMAIIAGLNMSPVARLKKTWNKIQSGKFSILEHQMDPSSNFSSYRSTLKAAMWRSAGATDQRQRIVIPFFSLLVKDLYFLNEGCSNKLPNGHVNFEKFWQLAKQVTEFITWKQVTCPFDKCTKVITFLQASPVLTENALALASFECEPPENNLEKERYKALK